jgi:hypothetical protein
MSNLIDWTLNSIRSEEAMLSWMEERRFDWVPLVNDFMEKIVNGTTIVLVVDKERSWLEQYIVSFINKESKNRPYLPIISKSDLGNEDLDVVIDMLDMSFKSDYLFWYIGKASGSKFKLVRKREDSFMFVMDDEIQNSFFLRSKDEYLDIKLINLIRLLDKTVDGVLFGDIDLDG